MSYNIFNVSGKEAQYLRTKLSPVFTPSKFRSMVPFLLQRAMIFKEWLDTTLLQNEQINCSDSMDKLTADFTSTCLFHYDMQCMHDGKNEVIECAKNANRSNWKNNVKRLMIEFAMPLYNLIGYYAVDNAKSLEVFTRFANNVVEYRKRYGIVKHDMANMLISLKEDTDEFAQEIGKFP